MLFAKKKPSLTRQQQLASRPRQMVSGEMIETTNGGARLEVKIQSKRWSGWLLKLPEGAVKKFELDALGRFVWEKCDGKHTVQQIARLLAKKYRVTEREAQVSTELFLKTLARKGLVGAEVPVKEKE